MITLDGAYKPTDFVKFHRQSKIFCFLHERSDYTIIANLNMSMCDSHSKWFASGVGHIGLLLVSYNTLCPILIGQIILLLFQMK